MGLLTPLAVRIGAISWLPRFLPQLVATDHAVQRVTRGRLTILDIAGLPSVRLTVVGRRSGIPRTTPLLGVPHEGGWVVAGSNFGHPASPAWVANLRAAGETQVTVGRGTRPVTAEEVDGAERDRLWEVLLATWPNFVVYAARTDRVIPVFRLTPARSLH